MTISRLVGLLLYTVLVTTCVLAQFPERLFTQNRCTSKSTCSECMQTPSCAWCNDPDFVDSTKRCMKPDQPAGLKYSCKEHLLLNPDNQLITLQYLPLSQRRFTPEENGSKSATPYGENSAQKIVQVAPQKVNLKLRVEQFYSINMDYTQAEDFPLDVYFLMDLSSSMPDHKEQILSLAQTIQNITSNFRIGFGTFIHKVDRPRNITELDRYFVFQPQLKLSTDTFFFSKTVALSSVSGNLDTPEIGFDTILQVVACRNKIGWRENAKRLLVIFTDATFHFAGEKTLDSNIKPNDGKCHLNEYGQYKKPYDLDYPSIEQINLNIRQTSINLIFVVTESKKDVYKKLTEQIEGASMVQIQNDTSNIVDVIKEHYERISSTVEMKHNASSHVNIKFLTSCLNETRALVETNKCDKIKVGDVINFELHVELLKCPNKPTDIFQTIQIYPVGINERLVINLEMLCTCSCEKPGNMYYEELSPKCSGQGTNKCGVCHCNAGAFGRRCECLESSLHELQSCLPPQTTTGIVCSGRGQCICGKCDCDVRSDKHEQIYGKFCECDNFSCARHEGILCSGPEHGVCNCGLCKCKAGWTGFACAHPYLKL